MHMRVLRRSSGCLKAEVWTAKSIQMNKTHLTNLDETKVGWGSPPMSLLVDLQARTEDLDVITCRKVFERCARPNRSGGSAILKSKVGESAHVSTYGEHNVLATYPGKLPTHLWSASWPGNRYICPSDRALHVWSALPIPGVPVDAS